MSDNLPETVADIHAYFSDGDQWNCAGECAHLRTMITALRAALDQEREKVERLRSTLRLLVDHQNGCPLPKYAEQWGRAMKDATALLSGRGEGEGNG